MGLKKLLLTLTAFSVLGFSNNANALRENKMPHLLNYNMVENSEMNVVCSTIDNKDVEINIIKYENSDNSLETVLVVRRILNGLPSSRPFQIVRNSGIIYNDNGINGGKKEDGYYDEYLDLKNKGIIDEGSCKTFLKMEKLKKINPLPMPDLEMLNSISKEFCVSEEGNLVELEKYSLKKNSFIGFTVKKIEDGKSHNYPYLIGLKSLKGIEYYYDVNEDGFQDEIKENSLVKKVCKGKSLF